MTKSNKPVDSIEPLYTDINHRHFHSKAATEQQLSAAHKKAADQLKDVTKFGAILKKCGGGLSRHRP